MLEERVAQLEEQLEEQLLGGEGDGKQQQQLRLQAEDHLLERSKLRSTQSILSACNVVFPQVTVLSSASQPHNNAAFRL